MRTATASSRAVRPVAVAAPAARTMAVAAARAAVGVVVVVLLTAGCGLLAAGGDGIRHEARDGSGEARDAQATDAVPVDPAAVVVGADGTVRDGGVPEGFPVDFPLPPGAVAAGGVSGRPGIGTDLVATFVAPGTPADVVAHMVEALPVAGYEVTSTTSTPTNEVLQVRRTGLTGFVAVNPQGEDMSQVTVILDLAR